MNALRCFIQTLLHGVPCVDLTQYLVSSGETDRNTERAKLYGWRVGRWIHDHAQPAAAIDALVERRRIGERVIARHSWRWEQPALAWLRNQPKTNVVTLRRKARGGAA